MCTGKSKINWVTSVYIKKKTFEYFMTDPATPSLLTLSHTQKMYILDYICFSTKSITGSVNKILVRAKFYRPTVFKINMCIEWSEWNKTQRAV